MSENRSLVKACTSLLTNGHVIIAALTAVSIAGTGVGVYTSLKADIVDNTRSVQDLRLELDRAITRDHNDLQNFVAQVTQWESDEKRYDDQVKNDYRIMDQRFMHLGDRIHELALRVPRVIEETPRDPGPH